MILLLVNLIFLPNSTFLLYYGWGFLRLESAPPPPFPSSADPAIAELTRMEGQENVKHLEDCSVSNALGTWVFSVAGALLAIPVGIKRKSLAPLVFFGTTGTMLDIIMGITACEREHTERQMKLLEAQNSPNDGSLTSESGGES